MGVWDWSPIVASMPQGWIVGPDGLSGASHDPGGQQHGDGFDEELMLRQDAGNSRDEEMSSSINGSMTSASMWQAKDKIQNPILKDAKKRLAVLPNTSDGEI